MPFFMDTGGGDIYAAETKEECIKAMLEDNPDLAESQDKFFEVDGSKQLFVEDEDESASHHVETLKDAYTNMGYGYLIATVNC
jgi:hypothetical protein